MPSIETRTWVTNGCEPLEVAEHRSLNRRDREVYVYLASDDRGRLLYVGITNDVYLRLAGHARSSAWYPQMHHLRVETHHNREAAIHREAALIALHNPPFNKMLRASYASQSIRRVAAIARTERLERDGSAA